MKYIASYSGGKDSQAMVLKLIEMEYPLDEILCYLNGVEFDAVIKNVMRMKALCEEKGIKFTILEPEEEVPVRETELAEQGWEKKIIKGKEVFLYYMIEKPVCKKTGEIQCGYKWCNGCARWGTRMKLDAIEKHNRTYGDEVVVEYVGIAADETHRINRRRSKNRIKLYPLVEWGMKEADCLEYCYSHGWHWEENGRELYDLLDRVSCKYCGNKSLKELRNVFHYMPDLWAELEELTVKTGFYPYREDKDIFDLKQRFITEDAQMSLGDFIKL